MSDITMFIWLAVYGVIFLGGIPYLIWMCVTAIKKRWRKLSILLIVPVAGYGVLTVTTGLIDRVAYKSYLRGIFDASVKFNNPVFQYDSGRSFHGDGYSIEVHILPDSVRERFESADAGLSKRFPERPSYRKYWETVTWREAPLDPAFEACLSFALLERGGDFSAELAGHFANIQSALRRKRAFYAFFKNGSDESPTDVDMFVVDLERGRVYMINHNT